MYKMNNVAAAAMVLGVLLLSRPGCAQETAPSERETIYYRYLTFPSLVEGGSLEPHWLTDGSSFWYAESDGDPTTIYKVDPADGTRTLLIDTARLRVALRRFDPDRAWPADLVVERFSLLGGDTVANLTVDGNEYVVPLETYAVSRAPPSSLNPHAVPRVFWSRPGWGERREELSPDGRWLAGINDHDVYLRSTDDGRTSPLTADGEPWYEWNLTGATPGSRWSPDGSKLAIKKVDTREIPESRRVELTPAHVEYKTRTELFIIDIRSGQRLRVDTGRNPGERIQLLGWRQDGSELLYLVMDRGFERLELRAANVASGATRVIVSEQQETFVLGVGWEGRQVFRRLEDGERFIWGSERDGWNHLYLYGLDGTLLRPLTRGNYPIVQVEAVDERNGWVYFTASGDQRRPYDLHLYRVTLEGRDLERLTEQPGQHSIAFSPSKRYYLDSHSAPDRAPVVELRRADGRLIQLLSRANVDALRDLQWQPPEQFVVKAGDGRTDLHGLLFKPYDFDPGKTYPVIEYIYGGPHLSLMGTWGRLGSFLGRDGTEARSGAVFGQALAQLGFIVFMVDGRGTPDRGKTFQDFGHGAMGLHEIPEHVAVLEGLARERPYMDLGRVGLVGRSFGGYMVLRAMLTAPDVYHVGAANDPFVELSTLEGRAYVPYLGWLDENPEAYELVSVLPLAGNLEGRLLLSHGEGHYAWQVMRLMSTLTEAGKDFDLLPPLQGQAHLLGGVYTAHWREAVRTYFQEHLRQ